MKRAALLTSILAVVLTLILCGASATVSGAGSRTWDSDGPGPKDLKSEWVRFTTAGLMFSPSEGLAIGLEMENRSESPIWVRLTVRGPASDVACEKTMALPSKQSAAVVCWRDTILPDVEYPMTVEVFRDSALTSAVEQTATQMRFRKKHLDELGGLREATALPRVYENIAYKKKLGLTTALFGHMGPPKEGTVTVSATGVEWKSKKETLSVPVAQIRAVRMEELGPRDAWAVVEYQEGDAARVMALQPSMLRGSSDITLMFTSLKALFDKR
jgi:hypothetical protein